MAFLISALRSSPPVLRRSSPAVFRKSSSSSAPAVESVKKALDRELPDKELPSSSSAADNVSTALDDGFSDKELPSSSAVDNLKKSLDKDFPDKELHTLLEKLCGFYKLEGELDAADQTLVASRCYTPAIPMQNDELKSLKKKVEVLQRLIFYRFEDATWCKYSLEHRSHNNDSLHKQKYKEFVSHGRRALYMAATIYVAQLTGLEEGIESKDTKRKLKMLGKGVQSTFTEIRNGFIDTSLVARLTVSLKLDCLVEFTADSEHEKEIHDFREAVLAGSFPEGKNYHYAITLYSEICQAVMGSMFLDAKGYGNILKVLKAALQLERNPIVSLYSYYNKIGIVAPTLSVDPDSEEWSVKESVRTISTGKTKIEAAVKALAIKSP